MILLGSAITLALFLLVGWAVSTEMFQQRTWRRRIERGDPGLVVALIEEALTSIRSARPPKDVASGTWAGVQRAQLVAVTEDSATVSVSAEPSFRTEGGSRVQESSAIDEAIALAAKLADLMLYDVPNLRLRAVRVDVFSTFTEGDAGPVQRAILTTTAERAIADQVTWEAMTPAEILGRFQTIYRRGPGGQGLPIDLPEVRGVSPHEAAALPATATGPR